MNKIVPDAALNKLRELLLRRNPWLDPWSESFVRRLQFGSCGEVVAGRFLRIAPHLCTAPGRGYSWPGSCSDRTVRGVYLHEVGHVVHFALGASERLVLETLRNVKEPRVSSYEPNSQETFAETFRIFAGNPGLLLEGRPRRFHVLTSYGIEPPTKPVAWDKGLAPGAKQRHYDMCERWISRGK